MLQTAEEVKETVMTAFSGCCGKLSAGLF